MPSSKPAEAKRPVLLTMGEPSGIGPEIAVKAWKALGGQIDGRALKLVGARAVFDAAAHSAGIEAAPFAGAIIDTGHRVAAEPGRPSPANADAVTGAIALAVRACQDGGAAALVTAPIHKSVLTAAGFGFPGHTEYLAHLTGIALPVMMLASHDCAPALRVVPLTIHMAVRAMLAEIKSTAIVETARVILTALARDFGCARPRLAIAGLNPHAGEDGTMGREEIEIIAPAIAALRSEGHSVAGPLPADTLFHDEARAIYDAALCMYHDQALIPIKTLAFWSGVNVTLGLPIVRTSPDHGTAIGIAGRGLANEKSMIAAIAMAADIAARRGL